MKSHLDCILKRPDIFMDTSRHFILGSFTWCSALSPEIKLYFCQNDRNQITPAMTFKRTCTLKAKSKVCSHESLMPVWNFISAKITDMKSIPVWVSFYLSSFEHQQRVDWTPKGDFQQKWNFITVRVHFASHVKVQLLR